jgi:hypothetical protein
MKRFAAGAWRILKGLPLALAAPVYLALAALGLLLADAIASLRGRNRLPAGTKPATAAASIVIPNWNGRDLLEKYLPSVIASTEDHPGSEIIVVDNGSEDGSAEFVRERFPQVTVLALANNLGFGGGSNAGFRAAKNDIVVLLNSDMRVERNFLAPLLAGFQDENTFAVSCQIFFSNPDKVREETGLTEGWWQQGGLKVRHRVEPDIDQLFPCFYGGGGSCAFDRRKFLSWEGSTNCLRRSTWKTPTLDFWLGSAAGRCCISPPASSITSIAGPLGSASATGTSKASSRRISCSTPGRTSMNGAG